jgi:beta-galactosidase GanA
MRYKRPDKDGALMRQAGFSVVRMAKSTWSLWEPANPRSDFKTFCILLQRGW